MLDSRSIRMMIDGLLVVRVFIVIPIKITTSGSVPMVNDDCHP